MPVHELKTWPEYFSAVSTGEKNFEVRKNDRNFNIGDDVILREYDPETGYTDQTIKKEIVYILDGGQFGIEVGYVVLALNDPDL